MKNIILDSTWYERLGLLFMAGLTALIWILATGIFEDGPNDYVHWFSTVTMPTLWLFFICVALFHVGLFTVATRSLIRNAKNTILDSIMLGVGVMGMIVIVISIVGFIYFNFGPIEWFFNISQYTVFVVGLLMEVSTMLYYGLTE
jgi:hypothetical protein